MLNDKIIIFKTTLAMKVVLLKHAYQSYKAKNEAP
jgi:hypothetical protein